MTMPNGPEGITPGLKYTITGDPALGDTPAALTGRTQDAIQDEVKADQITSGDSVYSNPSGPFGVLSRILGMAGKGPFDAVFHRLAQALLDKPQDHTWPTLDELLGALGTIPTTLTEHTEAIANLDTIAAAMQTTQAYVGDMQDMVTVPRCLLAITGPDGYKCWEVDTPILAIGGTSLNTTLLPVIYPRTYPSATRGDIYYTPVVVDRRGTVDKLRWIVGADSSIFSIDYYETALSVYNPSNGNVEKVWGSGNLVDGIANTTNLREVEVAMGLDQHVTPGQILFVAHQQVGPGLGQSPRAFAAVPQGKVARPSSLLLDAACYKATNHSQGIPSSIPLDSLSRENRYIPWAGVSVYQ